MKMDEIRIPDIEALVAFGKVGIQMMASRMLSLLSLFGIIALSSYSVYASSWQGAACVGVLALLVFGPALKAETKGREAKSETQAQ
jgi:hypothetical protein